MKLSYIFAYTFIETNMNLVFLANGQACYLKEKIGNKYIVNKIYEYDDEESGLIEITDTNEIVVEEIFLKPPIEKIDKEIKELQLKKKATKKEISELERTKREIQMEVDSVTRTQITNSKFIINRSDILNAKSLALFHKDRPMPMIMDSKDKSFRGLKLSLTVEISTGTERKWGYMLYYDYSSSGDYLCEKYGVLVNPTQEEIDEIIIKRLKEFDFSDWFLRTVPDKYLTEALLKRKVAYFDTEKKKEIERLEQEIEKSQKRLKELEN